MQKLEEVERLVKELSARENALHVLVNNAGMGYTSFFEEGGCVSGLSLSYCSRYAGKGRRFAHHL